MRSDIHHLFPTHQRVSSARGNSPFGEVPDAEATAWYGSDPEGQHLLDVPAPPQEGRVGFSEDFSDDEFEPPEAHKGDAARAVFYFFTMYPTAAGAIEGLIFSAQQN
jgi:endonuclease I